MKRQRLFVTLSLLAITVILWAGPISKETARQKAQAFLTQQLVNQGVRSSARAVEMKMVDDVLAAQYADRLYLFNATDGNGFVIISGDDRTETVLGYSTRGSIDINNLPVNLRSWLQHYAEEIAFIQKYNISATRQAAANCGDPIASTLTCRWNQNPVYNRQCPQVKIYSDEACTELLPYGQEASTNPVLSVTGCAATAMAQVLYQWKSVTATTAEIPARKDVIVQDVITQASFGEVGRPMWVKFSDVAIPAGTPIDWDLMLDDYFERDENGYSTGVIGTEVQQDAVASLMHICGAGMEMGYGVYFGSGSNAIVLNSMKMPYTYLGFTNISCCGQYCYPYQDWLQALYDELKVAKAVWFCGQASGGGHAFVIDGYEKEDFFHVNWGWGGMCDGLYRMNSMKPIEQGTGGTSGDDGYHMGQFFFRGLYPDAPAQIPELNVARFSVGEKQTVKVKQGQFVIPTIAMNVESCSHLETSFKLGFIIEAVSGGSEIVSLMEEFNPITLGMNFWGNLDGFYFAAGTIPDGEYLMRLAYCTPTSDWKPCRGSEERYVKLTVSGTTMVVEDILPYELSVVSSDNPETYEPNEPINFEATLKVEKGSVHESIISQYKSADDPSAELEVCGEDFYYLEAGDTFDVNFKLPEGLPEGTYAFYALNERAEGKYICTITVSTGETAIQGVVRQPKPADGPVYNLNGQRVSESFKGIILRNGQKILK